jgi:hypothetical protein
MMAFNLAMLLQYGEPFLILFQESTSGEERWIYEQTKITKTAFDLMASKYLFEI